MANWEEKPDLKEKQDDLDDDNLENKERKLINTSRMEILSPFMTIIFSIVGVIDGLYTFAFGGIILGIFGIVMAKMSKQNHDNRKVLLFNIIATDLAFIVSGLWVIVLICR